MDTFRPSQFNGLNSSGDKQHKKDIFLKLKADLLHISELLNIKQVTLCIFREILNKYCTTSTEFGSNCILNQTMYEQT